MNNSELNNLSVIREARNIPSPLAQYQPIDATEKLKQCSVKSRNSLSLTAAW